MIDDKNFFAQFDDDEDAGFGAPEDPPKNPFEVFDSEPDTTVIEKTTTDQKPEEQETPELPEPPEGASWFTQTAFDELESQEKERKRSEKEALDTERGNSFLEGITDPQQYAEFFKGPASGAIRMFGMGTEAVAGYQTSHAHGMRKQAVEELALLERIDRGEPVALNHGDRAHLLDYRYMNDEERAAYKDEVRKRIESDITPLRERTAFKTGQSIIESAKEVMPPEAGYEQAVGRQLGEGIGSLLAGLPFSYLGTVPAATFFAAAGSGEAVERAIAFDEKERKAGRSGLSDEQIAVSGLWGIGPGTTDLLPVEVLLGRLKIPQPFRKRFARAIGRIGGQAFIEGVQEGGQGFLQNVISQEIYNPEQELGEGVVHEAGIGAGVGGIAQTTSESAKLLLARFAGRRSGSEPAPREEIKEAAEAIDQAKQVQRENKADQLETGQPTEPQPTEPQPTEETETPTQRGEPEEAPTTPEEGAPDAEQPAEEAVEGEEAAGAPEFNDVLEILPDDPGGLPDVGILQQTIQEDYGKRFWNDLVDDEKVEIFRLFEAEMAPAQEDDAPPRQGAVQSDVIKEGFDSEYGIDVKLEQTADGISITESGGHLDQPEATTIRVEPHGVYRIAESSGNVSVLNELGRFVSNSRINRLVTDQTEPDEIAFQPGTDESQKSIAILVGEHDFARKVGNTERADKIDDLIRDVVIGNVSADDALQSISQETQQEPAQAEPEPDAFEPDAFSVTKVLVDEGRPALRERLAGATQDQVAQIVEAQRLQHGGITVEGVRQAASTDEAIDLLIEGNISRNADRLAAAETGNPREAFIQQIEQAEAQRPVPAEEDVAAEQPGDDVVATYAAELERTLGTDEFPDVLSRLTADRSVKVKEAKAISRQFAGSPGRSKGDAFALIRKRHDSLAESKRRAEATGGRSAALAARDLPAEFLRVIRSDAARDQWAEQLGVTEAELEPLIEEQIQAGRLRRARDGKVWRTAQTRKREQPADQDATGTRDDIPPSDPDILYALRGRPSDEQRSPETGQGEESADGTESGRAVGAGRTAAGARRSAARAAAASRKAEQRVRQPVTGERAFKIGRNKGRVEQRTPQEDGLERRRYQVLRRGKPIVTMEISERPNQTAEIQDIEVDPEHRRRGWASKLYDFVERDFGVTILPSKVLTEDGRAFWQRRNPDFVADYRLDAEKGEYLRADELLLELQQVGRIARSDRDADARAWAQGRLADLELLWESLPLEVHREAAAELVYREEVSNVQAAMSAFPAFRRWFGDSKVVDEAGNPIVVYHGTTFDIARMNVDRTNRDGNLGAGFYFSSTVEDASANYTGEGPDLAARINERIGELTESIEEEIGNLGIEGALERFDIDMAESILSRIPLPAQEALEVIARQPELITGDIGRILAARELSGGQDNVIPAFLSLQNPVVIGGPDETVFTRDDELPRLMDELRGLAGEYDNIDIDTLTAAVEDVDAIGAADLWDRLMTPEGLLFAEDPNDFQPVGPHVLRTALERMGFDGIADHTVDRKFGTQSGRRNPMTGMHPDTVHYVAFRPEQVKSATGNRGTFSRTKDDLLYALHGVHTTRGVFEQFDPEFFGGRSDAGWWGRGVYMFPREYAVDFGTKSPMGTSWGSSEGQQNLLLRIDAKNPFYIETTTETSGSSSRLASRADYAALREHGWSYDRAPVEVWLNDRTWQDETRETYRDPAAEEAAAAAKAEAREIGDRYEDLLEEAANLLAVEEGGYLIPPFITDTSVLFNAIQDADPEVRGRLEEIYGQAVPLQIQAERAEQRANNLERAAKPEARLSQQFTDALLAAGYDAVVLRSEDGVAYEMVAIKPGTVESELAGDPMFALPGFYSPAIRAVKEVKDNEKRPLRDWINWLTGHKQYSIRNEEIEWLGLESWDEGKQKKSVSRDELRAFMEAHQMQLEEVQHGGRSQRSLEEEATRLADQEYETQVQAVMDEAEDRGDHFGLGVNIELIEPRDGDGETWGYEVHVGGELVESEDGFASDTEAFDEAARVRDDLENEVDQRRRENLRDWARNQVDYDYIHRRTLEELEDVNGAPNQQYAFKDGENYTELLIRWPKLEGRYRSEHFDDHEIVYVRFDTVTLPDGRKALRIQEIQSDIHQRAARAGYRTAVDEARLADLKEERQAFYQEFEGFQRQQRDAREAVLERIEEFGISDEYAREVSHAALMNSRVASGAVSSRHARSSIENLDSRQQEIFREILRSDAYNALEDIHLKIGKHNDQFHQNTTEINALEAKYPEAPFKDKSWEHLALKRMLLYAVENGHDAVTWSRADQIAPAVGGEVANLAPRYDKRFANFLKSYTRKWGGRVERAVLGEQRKNIRPFTQADADELRQYIVDITGGLDDAGNSGARAQASLDLLDEHGTDIIALHEAAMRDQREGVEILRYLTSSHYTTAKWASEDLPTNQVLYITDKMRESVRAGQPLALRGDRNVDGLLTEENLDSFLGEWRKILPPGVMVRVVDKLPEGALGAYKPSENLVMIAAHAANPNSIFRHEVIHALRDAGLFSKAEWAMLVETATRYQDQIVVETPDGRKLTVEEVYGEVYRGRFSPERAEEAILEEMVATMVQMRAEGYTFGPESDSLTDRIRRLMARLRNWVRAGLWRSSSDILADVELGRIARRAQERVQQMNRDHERVERFAPPPAETRDGRAPAAPAQGQGALAASTAPVVRAGHLPGARGFQPSQPPGTPVKGLSEIVRDLERALGMTVRQGRLDPGLKRRMRAAGAGDVLGQYNRQTGVARLQIRNDIDVLSHEAGHHIEGKMGQPLADLKQTHAGELTPLASPGPDALSEGFSEWLRRYITNPAAARNVAPTFHDAFEQLVDQSSPALLQSLHEAQSAYEGLITGDPQDVKIANQTVLLGRDNSFTRFLRDAEGAGVVDTMSDRLHWLYFSMVGKNHGWWFATRQLLDLVERNTGQRIDLKAVENPNKLLRRLSHTTSWAMQDLKRGVATAARPNGGGVSMHDVLRTAFGDASTGIWNQIRRASGREQIADWNETALKTFGDYLISRRAILLYVRYRPALRQYIESYIQQHPEIDYMLARLPQNAESTLPNPPTLEPLLHHLESLMRHEAEQPQFRQAAEMYYQFNDDMLLFLHEKGLLSDEDLSNLQQQNDYAPFQRDMSDREMVSGAQASRRGAREAAQANKYAVYQSIHGSMRDLINPVQSTVQFVYEMRLRAALNDTLVAMDELARRAGPGGGAIFERLPAHEAEGYTVDIQNALKRAARDAGLSEHDTTAMLGNVEQFIGPNATATLFTMQQAGERGERIVWFYENGKPVPAQLADGTLGQMLFEGFTTMGKRSADTWMKVLALPAIGVRFGVTRSFEFIFRNIFVDAITAPVNSPYGMPFTTQASGLKQILGGGEYHRLYNRYAGMLGGEATQAISDQSIDRDIKRLRTQGFHIRRPKSVFEFFRMAFQLGEFTETATRVGIFKKAMESAMADGLSEHEAAAEAAHHAHDVIDFSRHGSKTEAIRRTIPFWNAAVQGMDKYVRAMTGQGDHGSAVKTWLKYRDGQHLTEGEKRDLKQAGKAWFITTIVFGGASWIFHMLGADDEDYDEIPDRIRATHWRVNLDGIMYLIPKDVRTFLPEDTTLRLPKGFETAWFANAVERALDAAKKDDPTAFRRYLEDFWEITHPPDGVPALDIPYGFMAGKDFFTGRDIIPFWEKDLEREEQFGPYTTESSKKIGEWLNVSPYYVDHIVRGLGASVARDVQTGIDLTAGKGPRPGIEDYPIARRFTYNTARSSRSLQRFYDMYKDREGLVSWFWDTVSSDARSFMAAKSTYKAYLDDNNEAAAEELYDRLNDDQKVFATLGVKFERTKSKYRNLHPMENAAEGMTATNKLMKEVVGGEILVGKQERRVTLDRSAMRFIRNELGHIRQGMAQNGLHIIGTPGWSNLQRMDVGKRLDVLKEGAPAVYDELMRRLNKDGYVEMDHLAEVWPDVKQRVLDDRENALLADLLAGGPVQKTYSGGLEATQ